MTEAQAIALLTDYLIVGLHVLVFALGAIAGLHR